MRSSNTKKFKYCLIITLISVILVRLYFIFSFSAFEVVPEKLVLLLALFVMTVIWVLERNDRRELLAVKKKLHKSFVIFL